MAVEKRSWRMIPTLKVFSMALTESERGSGDLTGRGDKTTAIARGFDFRCHF